MGTIVARPQKDGSTRYRAQIRIMQDGVTIHNESRTFSKQAMAKAWLAKREAELEVPGAIGAKSGLTIAELLARYAAEVSDGFGRTKAEHIKQLQGFVIAKRPAHTLQPMHLMAHIQERRKTAGPATVNNDLVWLRIAFKYARTAWGMSLPVEAIDQAAEAARSARLIGKPKRRTRRPTPEELERLDALFARQRFRKDGTSPPMRLVMWLAIYSCRRLSELVSLRIEDFDEPSRTYLVRDLKHPDGSEGNDKIALLPAMGWEVFEAIRAGRTSGLLLPYGDDAISAAFTRACRTLGIDDLRFHDLRHEGASRLAEDGSTIPEIQQVTLHESWGSLQIYVNLHARRQRRVDFTPSPSSASRQPVRAHQDTAPVR